MPAWRTQMPARTTVYGEVADALRRAQHIAEGIAAENIDFSGVP